MCFFGHEQVIETHWTEWLRCIDKGPSEGDRKAIVFVEAWPPSKDPEVLKGSKDFPYVYMPRIVNPCEVSCVTDRVP